MTRALGFAPNGRITGGRCHHCGHAVDIQHGHMPGEIFQRHYFECPGCGARGMLYPLQYCAECHEEGQGEPVYLLHVGGYCPFVNLTTNYTVEQIQAAMARRKVRAVATAVQLRLL